MFIRLVSPVLILVLISGCVSKPSTLEVKTKELEPATSNGPIPTSIQKQIVIHPTSTERSTIKQLEPKIKKICPPKAEVSIDKLGLPENIGLFAVGENEFLGNTSQPLRYGLLLLSGARLAANQKIEISSGNDLVNDVIISPSGQWMAILRRPANSLQVSIWVGTIDGKKQWKVVDISIRKKAFWVSDGEILIVGVANEAEYEGRIPEENEVPLFSINPFTLEQRPLGPLPQDSVYDYNSYHSRDGGAYSIYHKKNNEKKMRFLYDYSEGTSTPIFLWIDFSDPTVGIGIRPNGLYYVGRRVGNGIDFALDLNMEQITTSDDYNDIMKHFSMNDHPDLLISPMIGMTKSDILILTSPINLLDNEKPTPLFFYDYKANLIKDYCIRAIQSSVYVNFSPDERFVALTIAKFVDNRETYYVLIVNLTTGYYSVIENIKAVGFGIIP